MGWLSDMLNCDPAHEGWVAGCPNPRTVPPRDDELGYGDEPQDVVWLRAACQCGWRSDWTTVPGARWVPYSVDVDDVIRDAISLAWSEHVKTVVTAMASA